MNKFERGRKRNRNQPEKWEAKPSENLIDEQLESLPDESDLSRALSAIFSTWKQSPKMFKASIIERAYKQYCSYPHLLPTISSMIGYFSLTSEEFLSSLTTYLTRKSMELQSAKNFPELFKLIRFISDLVNASVYSCKSIISLYNELLNSTKLEDVPTLYINWVLITVMDSLIWMAGRAQFDESLTIGLNEVIDRMEEMIKKRNVWYVKAYRIWIDKSNKVPHIENVEVSWKNLKLLQSAGWKWPGIVRPYFEMNELKNLKPVDFPVNPFSIGHKIDFLPEPEVISQIFSDNLQEERDGINFTNYLTFPPPGSVVRKLFSERLSELFASVDDVRKAASVIENMVNDPVYEIPFIVVEYILLDVLALPSGKHCLMFCASLAAYFHTKEPRFKDALERAVMIIFRRIEIMSIMSLQRFTSWFAYFLAVIECSWPWEMMTHFVNQSMRENGFLFLTELFFQLKIICGRSYLKGEAILEPFKEFFANPEDPNYLYGKDSDFDKKYQTLRSNMIQIYTENNYSDILSLKPTFPDDFSPAVAFPPSVSQFDALFIEVVLQFTLKAGHKILGQGLVMMQKMREILCSILSSEDEQVYALHCIHFFWRSNPVRLEAIFMHLFILKVISPMAIIRFMFDERVIDYHRRFYFWEIIEKMFMHIVKRINELKEEFIKTKKETVRKSKVVMRDSDEQCSDSANESSITDNDSDSEESSNSHSDISDKVRHRPFRPSLNTMKSLKKMQEKLEEEKASLTSAVVSLFEFTVKLGEGGKRVGKDYFSVLHRLQNTMIKNFRFLKNDIQQFDSRVPPKQNNAEETLILIVYQRFCSLFQ